MPELLQGQLTQETLYDEVQGLVVDGQRRDQQIKDCQTLTQMLEGEGRFCKGRSDRRAAFEMTFLIDVDHQIFFFLNALAHTMVGDFFALVTWWGDGRICIPVMTFVAWRHRGDLARTEWQRLFLFSAVLALMVVLLKTGLGRARPGAVFDAAQGYQHR